MQYKLKENYNLKWKYSSKYPHNTVNAIESAIRTHIKTKKKTIRD